MKKTLIFSSLLTITSLFGQENATVGNNKLAIDLNFGANKPLSSLTPGYETKVLNLYHFDFGARYMFNNKVGIKLNFGADKFSNSKAKFEYDTRHRFFTIQGILNAGNILDFPSFSKKLGLLVHFGSGIGIYKDHEKIISGKDRVGIGVFGFTPQYKISEKVALNADLSFYAALMGQKTFDFRSVSSNTGVDHKFTTISLGLSFYIGKGAKHNDWVVNSKFDNSKLVELENRVVAATQVLTVAENGTNPKVVKNEYPTSSIINTQVDNTNKTTADADKDGIADYLDKEPNTAEGAKVDQNGVTIK